MKWLAVVILATVAFLAAGCAFEQVRRDAAREAVYSYLAEAPTLRDERVRALHTIEQTGKALAEIEPGLEATYDSFGNATGNPLVMALAARFKSALMEAALHGTVVPENYTFDVQEVLLEMQAAATARLKE
jgi:hypothetical protein